MNTRLTKTLFFMFLFTLVNLVYSQDQFEGKVTFKMSHEDQSMSMDYFIKDKNIRMEMGEEAKGTVFIYSEGKSMILMPEQKMYMDLDNSMFKKMKEMMGKNNDENKDENDKDFDINKYKTGKTKTILGYKCEQWLFNDMESGEQEQVEAWVTDELGNFIFMENPMGSGFSPGWESSFKNKGFFPLLVITKNSDGNETSKFEATEIDKKSLSDNLFQVPSDYQEMKMPGM